MSLIVDKDAVIEDVMSAINKHYAGYEKNLSQMEHIIKQLPLVQQLIKENKELKERLESENIHIDVNEKKYTISIVDDIRKEMENAVPFTESNLKAAVELHEEWENMEKQSEEEEEEDRGLGDTSPEDEEEDRGLGDTSPEDEEEDRGLGDTSPEDEEEDRGLGDTSPEDEEEEEEEEEEQEEQEEQEQEEEEEQEEVEDRGLGETSPEEADAEEEDEEVFEVTIGDSVYYTTNETNGEIYECTIDGDVGDVVGNYENGSPKFT